MEFLTIKFADAVNCLDLFNNIMTQVIDETNNITAIGCYDP